MVVAERGLMISQSRIVLNISERLSLGHLGLKVNNVSVFSSDRFLEHMQLILSSSVTTITAQAKLFCTHLAPISRYVNGRNT